jgi:glycosyltransferase involved in cell wall biosynthesis
LPKGRSVLQSDVLRVAINVEQLMSPSPGGVGRYTAKLVSNLAALGVEVKTVVARHTPEEVRLAWAEFELGAVPGPTVLPLPRAALYDAWHLLDWPPVIRDADVDVVHAPSLAVPPKNGKPLVVSIHDAGPWLFPSTFPLRGRWFHRAGVRAASRRADRVLTGTEAAASELRAHTSLPADRLRVIPYGVDHPYRQSDPDQVRSVLEGYDLHDRRYVLWVGSLEPRKGLTTLVSALSRLALRNPAPTLVLAGYAGWRNASIISPEDRAVLGGALRELGRVSEPELQALYAGASVFAFPSWHEGFGLPVLEAMVAGVPVVASDIPALREVAGDAAVLVPPRSPDLWAEALSRVLESAPLRAELAAAGRSRAALFSWRRTAEATLAIYEELVAERG